MVRVMIGSVTALVTTGLVAILLLVVFSRSSYDPLTFENPQQMIGRVMTRDPKFSGPAAYLGQDVKVQGTKCNSEDHPVLTEGKKFWYEVQPRSFFVRDHLGILEVLPGCNTITFSNKMPQEVIARTREGYANGSPVVRWQISGEQTPLGHDNPLSEAFRTQTFAILPFCGPRLGCPHPIK
jgi:hypothetical protein